MSKTPLISLLNQDSGASVLRILEQESGLSLPKSGMVAGQAVTSALLQLTNQPGVVYNDIDLFGDRNWTPFDCVQRNPKNSVSFHNGSKLSNKTLTLQADPVYDNMVRWTRCNQTLQILDVRRDGDFNYVWYHAGVSGVNQNSLVLNTFDLNSVQVGVDLTTQQLMWTPQFEGWSKTRQVEINFIHSSVQTLSRFLDKAQHKGNYAFLEFETARCVAYYLADMLARFEVSGETFPSRQARSEIFTKIANARSNKFLRGSCCASDSLAYLHSLVETLQLIVVQLPADKIVCKGIPVIGQKYYEKMSKQPLLTEYFSFVKAGEHHLAVLKKLPKLIEDNPVVFHNYVSSRGLSFHGCTDAKFSSISMVNPSVSKTDKATLTKIYHELSSVHSDWLSFKMHASNMDRRELPPAEWLVGAGDTEMPSKYFENYQGHRDELRFFHKAKNIREFNTWCKKLYVNVDKVFAAESHQFYSVVRALNTEVLAAKAASVEVRASEYFSPETVLRAIKFFKDPVVLLSISFVEFCLNAMIERDRRTKEKDSRELVTRIQAEEYPVERLNKLGVDVVELITGNALKEEGMLMKHCVGGYSSSVENGLCRIFSLSLKEDPSVRSTLELVLSTNIRENLAKTEALEFGEQKTKSYKEDISVKASVGQNHAKYNKLAHETLQEAGKLLASHFTLNNKLGKYMPSSIASRNALANRPLPQIVLPELPGEEF